MLVEDSLISSQNLLFNLRSVENEKWWIYHGIDQSQKALNVASLESIFAV